MKRDVVIAGVGGQGILTVAVLIVNAAMRDGLNVRQAEIHGMSQRGGAVEAHVRLSDQPLFSDIVPKGRADVILATEPLEALRHIEYLAEDGVVITNTAPVKNISNYPPEEHVMAMLRGCRRRVCVIAGPEVAREAGSVRAQNVALVGAATTFLGVSEESLRSVVEEAFARKGGRLADVNLRALSLGAARVRELNGARVAGRSCGDPHD